MHRRFVLLTMLFGLLGRAFPARSLRAAPRLASVLRTQGAARPWGRVPRATSATRRFQSVGGADDAPDAALSALEGMDFGGAGAEERGGGAGPAAAADSVSAESGDAGVAEAARMPELVRGDAVASTILSFGPLGASVVLKDKAGEEFDGLISQAELALYRERRGSEPQVGDIVGDSFVSRVREDGRVDVSLRQATSGARSMEGRERIMATLTASNGRLDVGDKSSTEAIAALCPGMSKGDFKRAVGTLYKEGLVKPEATSISIMSAEERDAHLQRRADSGAARDGRPGGDERGPRSRERGGRGSAAPVVEADADCKVLVSNLPYRFPIPLLREFFEEGGATLAKHSKAIDKILNESGRFSGNAVVTFLSRAEAQEAEARNLMAFGMEGNQRDIYVESLLSRKAQKKLGALRSRERDGLAQNKKLLLKGIPRKWSRDDVWDFVEDVAGLGSVRAVDRPRNRDGQINRFNAEVTFQTAEQAKIALKDLPAAEAAGRPTGITVQIAMATNFQQGRDGAGRGGQKNRRQRRSEGRGDAMDEDGGGEQ